MIKAITVAICDICGHTEKAKPSTWRNETMYDVPDGWTRAAGNKDVHLCPTCSQVLITSRRYDHE